MKTDDGRDDIVETGAQMVRHLERTTDGTTSLAHACLWAVDTDLRTLGASLGFTQLVGFGQLLLVGLPWYVILPTPSRQTVEDIIGSAEPGKTASFALRHLDGHHIPVEGHRVYGGSGWHKVVLSINELATSRFRATNG
jgi:hypothetical protein